MLKSVLGLAYGHQLQFREKRVLFAGVWQMKVSTFYMIVVAAVSSSARVNQVCVGQIATIAINIAFSAYFSILLRVGHIMLIGGKA